MKKPEPTERERLQAEEDNLARRERASGETVHALKARAEGIDGEIGAAAAKGDDAAFSALADEAAALPAKLRAAQAAYAGIVAARAPISARLAELNREAVVGRLYARRSELNGEDEANAQDIRERVAALGRALAARERLVGEVAGLVRQLALYGASAPGVKPTHEILDEDRLALQRTGVSDARQVLVPLIA